jgi:hypothetical protein
MEDGNSFPSRPRAADDVGVLEPGPARLGGDLLLNLYVNNEQGRMLESQEIVLSGFLRVSGDNRFHDG